MNIKKIILSIFIISCSIISSQTMNIVGKDTLINVGNIRLNFNIIKGGSTTIIFEAGGGMDLTEWSKIVPIVAKNTGATVVSYDRAGYGKSDLPDEPINMKVEAGWLWDCLKQLGLNKNLILAGHSYGGWMIRMISSEHPDVIKGMVFIDPFTNEVVELVGAEQYDAWQKPQSARRFGLDPSEDFNKILSDPIRLKTFSKIQRATLRFWGEGGTRGKYETMKNTKIPAGIPVKVITSGKQWLLPDFWKIWRLSHERLTKSLPGAELIVAEKSDHMIPISQPEIVIDAINGIFHLMK